MRRLLLGLAALLSIQTLAFAQQSPPSDAKPEMRQPGCIGFISERSPLFRPVAFRTVALERDEVRINYVGHSTFLIEFPGHIRIATDYNDYVTPTVVARHRDDEPRAHDALHRPARPGIKYVLRGWGRGRAAGRIDIHSATCACAMCRPTSATGSGGTERHGNSIFIFEIANLCIAHLGHLHHTLTQQQLNEIGRSTSCWCRSTATDARP